MAFTNNGNDYDDKSTAFDVKEGALHKQLGIPSSETIPVSYLDQILNGDIGTTVRINGKYLTITPKLRKRAQFAKNFGHS